MSRLRIVRVMPFFRPRYGGSVTHGMAVSARLAERGHDVRIVTTDLGVENGVPRDRWVEESSYRVIYRSTRAVHRIAPYYTPILRAPLSAELAAADLLCLNVGLTMTNVLARRLAKPLGVPYVYNAEGSLCPERLRIKRLGKSLFLRLYERDVLRDAAALHAVTTKEARDLESLGADPRKIHVIPNGVELGAGRDVASGTPFRQRFGVPPDARLLLFLGRLHAIKGIELLLAALDRLRAALPDAWLVVAGPDDDGTRGRCERLARRLGIDDRVRFAGPVYAERKRAALCAADVLCLPSATEGLPLAALEACAAGLPVLLTPGCNLPEVQAFRAGLVVARSVGAIADGLREMLGSSDTLREMGEAARRMVERHFAIDHVVTRLEELYHEIAARSPVHA